MFEDSSELVKFLRSHTNSEGRWYEFKTDMPWSELKPSIVKSSLALANIRGGGYIIIGVSETDTIPRYHPAGMSKEHSESYIPDHVSSYVNEFADPYVDLELKNFSENGRNFIVIQVSEFEYEPVTCKKSHGDTVTRGKIYCRSHRMPESTPDLTISEMREIIELAVDKGIKRQFWRMNSYGITISPKPFNKEEEEDSKS